LFGPLISAAPEGPTYFLWDYSGLTGRAQLSGSLGLSPIFHRFGLVSIPPHELEQITEENR